MGAQALRPSFWGEASRILLPPGQAWGRSLGPTSSGQGALDCQGVRAPPPPHALWAVAVGQHGGRQAQVPGEQIPGVPAQIFNTVDLNRGSTGCAA